MGFTGEEDSKSMDIKDDMQQIAGILTKIKGFSLDLTIREQKIFDKFVDQYNIAAKLESE